MSATQQGNGKKLVFVGDISVGKTSVMNRFINNKFSKDYDVINEIYNKICEKEKSYDFEENKYNRRMTFEFSDAMKKWMEGKEFWEVLESTELSEGKLYNLIMRIPILIKMGTKNIKTWKNLIMTNNKDIKAPPNVKQLPNITLEKKSTIPKSLEKLFAN